MSPNKINAQNSIDGMEISSIARLHPRNAVSNPVVNVPPNAPIELIDPIQESCSYVNGPVFSGESSDRSVGIEGDIHPNNNPWPSEIILAKKMNEISHLRSLEKKFEIFWISSLKFFGVENSQQPRHVSALSTKFPNFQYFWQNSWVNIFLPVITAKYWYRTFSKWNLVMLVFGFSLMMPVFQIIRCFFQFLFCFFRNYFTFHFPVLEIKLMPHLPRSFINTKPVE